MFVFVSTVLKKERIKINLCAGNYYQQHTRKHGDNDIMFF